MGWIGTTVPLSLRSYAIKQAFSAREETGLIEFPTNVS